MGDIQEHNLWICMFLVPQKGPHKWIIHTFLCRLWNIQVKDLTHLILGRVQGNFIGYFKLHFNVIPLLGFPSISPLSDPNLLHLYLWGCSPTCLSLPVPRTCTFSYLLALSQDAPHFWAPLCGCYLCFPRPTSDLLTKSGFLGRVSHSTHSRMTTDAEGYNQQVTGPYHRNIWGQWRDLGFRVKGTKLWIKYVTIPPFLPLSVPPSLCPFLHGFSSPSCSLDHFFLSHKPWCSYFFWAPTFLLYPDCPGVLQPSQSAPQWGCCCLHPFTITQTLEKKKTLLLLWSLSLPICDMRVSNEVSDSWTWLYCRIFCVLLVSVNSPIASQTLRDNMTKFIASASNWTFLQFSLWSTSVPHKRTSKDIFEKWVESRLWCPSVTVLPSNTD